MIAVTDMRLISKDTTNSFEPHRTICNNDIQNPARYASIMGKKEMKQDKYIYFNHTSTLSLVQINVSYVIIFKRHHANTRYKIERRGKIDIILKSKETCLH